MTPMSRDVIPYCVMYKWGLLRLIAPPDEPFASPLAPHDHPAAGKRHDGAVIAFSQDRTGFRVAIPSSMFPKL